MPPTSPATALKHPATIRSVADDCHGMIRNSSTLQVEMWDNNSRVVRYNSCTALPIAAPRQQVLVRRTVPVASWLAPRCCCCCCLLFVRCADHTLHRMTKSKHHFISLRARSLGASDILYILFAWMPLPDGFRLSCAFRGFSVFLSGWWMRRTITPTCLGPCTPIWRLKRRETTLFFCTLVQMTKLNPKSPAIELPKLATNRSHNFAVRRRARVKQRSLTKTRLSHPGGSRLNAWQQKFHPVHSRPWRL